ncbi:MAG: LPS export ABC transporter permease LptG [Pseudomonadales bacterium]|nr:LPS export ABC transporter permease LptG [Pseudomonadales bacterium]
MNKLSSYIGINVISAILLVLFLIVGLDVVSAIIDQLDDLRDGYTFWQSLIYVGLTIPGRINEYIPLSALVGCLVAMGMLSSSSEITVIRASGVSMSRLVWMAMKPTLWLILISVLISEYVSPYTDQWAKSHKDFLRSGVNHSLVSGAGLWHREGDTFMHFNVVQPGGVLYGVTTFEFDSQGELLSSTFAKRASYQQNDWLMEGVSRSIFYADSIENREFTTLKWQTRLSPKMLGYLSLAAEDLSPTGLYDYAKYLEQQELDSGAYRLAFWQKCLHPLMIMSLVLVALSFIFGPLRSSTMGYRVFVGVVVGIAFQFTQNLLGPSSLIYGFSPFYAVLLPILICAIVGSTLLYRTR